MRNKISGFAYTDEVITEVVKAGFDPLYGARPLRRAIQRLIENPISNLIIDGKVKIGDLIRARVDKDELIFEIEKTVFQPKTPNNIIVRDVVGILKMKVSSKYNYYLSKMFKTRCKSLSS